MNALGSKYFCEPPRMTLPLKFGLTDGRMGFLESPLFVGLNPSCGVKGKPLCRLRIPLIIQPETKYCELWPTFEKYDLPRPKGSSYVPLTTARLRTSVVEGPQSNFGLTGYMTNPGAFAAT